MERRETVTTVRSVVAISDTAYANVMTDCGYHWQSRIDEAPKVGDRLFLAVESIPSETVRRLAAEGASFVAAVEASR